LASGAGDGDANGLLAHGNLRMEVVMRIWGESAWGARGVARLGPAGTAREFTRRHRPGSTRLMSYIRYHRGHSGAPPAAPMATSNPTADNSALPEPGASATPAFSPLYQQIKGLILQSLQAGEWKPGEAIPSEMELAARFRVSQGTVRKAIDELAAGNLVVRRQGKGTFVATHAEHHVQYRFLKLVPDSGDEGPAQREILDCRRVRASAEIARALQLRTGDSVVQVR